jgi:gliding motility-associated-like protein
VDIVQPVQGLYLKNVTVGNNQALATWVWDPTAEVKEAQLLSSAQNSGYQIITTLSPVPQPPLLTAENSIGDNSGAAGMGKVFYKIQAQDLCDSISFSGYGSTIFLTATSAPGNINYLEWTGFDMENAVVDAYSVFKINGNTNTQIGTLGASATSFDAEFDPSNPEDAQSCYYVVAQHTVTAPDGTTMVQQSSSNIACVEQQVRIFVPNAFVPEGFNTEFKPLLIFADLSSYEMRIFDRYGQEMFSTNDPDEGWNGKKDDRPMPQGTYVFLIKAVQANGRETEKRGTLLLLR